MSSQHKAQCLQESAHILQLYWFAACFAHSLWHALQIAEQRVFNSSLNAEPRASNRAHNAHISAQSRYN